MAFIVAAWVGSSYDDASAVELAEREMGGDGIEPPTSCL
jgi:hypothetical protein